MANIFTIQAIFISVSGRAYKSQPRELREGLDLDDYKTAIRSDLRLGQYPIQFVNELGHEQLIMPVQVETVIFNVLAVRPEHSFLEPEYDKLRQKWTEDLRGKTPEGQEITADHKLKQEAVQPVVPIQPGSATSTSLIPSSDQTVVYRYGGPRTPDPKVYNMATEETQEMQIPTASSEDTMATKAVERTVAGVAPKPTPSRPLTGPRETRRLNRSARSGKLPRD